MASIALKEKTASGFGELLGVKAANTLQLVRIIQDGLPFEALERIRRETNLPLEQLAAAIGISSRTLTRRKKEKKLAAFESDRLVSLSRLLAMTVGLFEGDATRAYHWFNRPNRALGGFSPLEMAATETGARETESLIGRLEHGVFA